MDPILFLPVTRTKRRWQDEGKEMLLLTRKHEHLTVQRREEGGEGWTDGKGYDSSALNCVILRFYSPQCYRAKTFHAALQKERKKERKEESKKTTKASLPLSGMVQIGTLFRYPSVVGT